MNAQSLILIFYTYNDIHFLLLRVL